MSMSARRLSILHGPAPGLTPRTTFGFTFGNVPSAFTGPPPLDAGITPIPPSNRARESLSCALTAPAIPIANTSTAAVLNITDRSFHYESRRAMRKSQSLLPSGSPYARDRFVSSQRVAQRVTRARDRPDITLPISLPVA